MPEKKEISLIDYLVIFVRHKRFLIGTTFLAMVVFYLTIFFLVEEKFDSSATIIPSQDNSMTGIASMLGNFSDLPLGLGAAANPEIGMYNTILKSRTVTELAIEKFDLWKVYDLNPAIPKQVKLARERFMDNLETEETEDGAYTIAMRSPNADLSAKITNFLIQYLNEKIVQLKVEKSKENRVFLGSRLDDLKSRLTLSEDSLRYYQEKSGILNPEEQIKSLISAYSIMETQLITKQLQKDLLSAILDENSPKLKNINIEVELFEKKLNSLKDKGKESSVFIPYDSIPEKAIGYLRHFREVEINNALLQFVLPLYEQAKIEEQKTLPVIQIIDYGYPAEEKSFPPRTIFTLIAGIIVFMILFVFVAFKSNVNLQNSEQYEFVRKNLFRWKVNA